MTLFERVYNVTHGIMSNKTNLRENKLLQEMACYRKNESGLPANLYLDDSGSWKKSGHWKRIKFQADKSDHPNTRDMIPMSISNDPQILVSDAKLRLSSSEIDQIKQFVKLNRELLLKLPEVGMRYFYDNVRRDI